MSEEETVPMEDYNKLLEKLAALRERDMELVDELHRVADAIDEQGEWLPRRTLAEQVRRVAGEMEVER